MKCLPQNKLAQAQGNVLHDWHAEILAIRAFNRFLVDECADLARKGFEEKDTGGWVRWRHRDDGHARLESAHEGDVGSAPFELRDDVSIHMYCSEAPCGDASMELTMAEQEDDTPWSKSSGSHATDSSMLGRGHFDRLGIVRRKPARPDAPLTLSKSCSDKLAMKQCTSLLSGLTSRLVWPENVYLYTLVLPESQYVGTAVERAFGPQGRMKAVASLNTRQRESWKAGGYAFKPFDVRTTTREFEYSRRSGTTTAAVPSNLSAMVTPQRQEILINGVLQGRKQFDPRGASCASRRAMWKDVIDVAATAGQEIAEVSGKGTCCEMKHTSQIREHVKKDVREMSLQRWERNVGDEEWKIEDS
ncbi:uncharacterized protein LTR77_008880 [Saxophila tyrrhenica]|uniref:A to I editase domain-containing protein n=1 Tax=Saxophila tyrrhenica TaxID=1690608 RepID=A0AAV9P474_9PEZI|nr:hypothetical protein LTR77_008880 [Saxophila tyrrhenica]